MRHFPWLAALCLPILALAFLRHAESAPTDAPARTTHALPNGAAFLGAGSCSASACHRNPQTRGIVGAEFAYWTSHDPHAKAYESLFNARALMMHKNLGGAVPPHEDERCLKCHVSPQYDAPGPAYFRTDGVSCETCHGPAQHWIKLHHVDGWKQRTAVEKQQYGMRDLHSLVGRAKTCVPCHVGAAGMEVDHDLIAAGHPRLHFEFAAFHAHMPRHWPDDADRKGRPDFEAQLWTIGQLATAHAEFEQLARRAESVQRVWPEFAEHDCVACHRDLREEQYRDNAKRKPGVLPWGGHVALVESVVKSLDAEGDAKLADALAKLRAAFDQRKPNRQEVGDNAKVAAARLAIWLNEYERRKPDSAWLTKFAEPPALSPGRDAAINQLLAAVSLRQARRDLGLPASPETRLDDFLRSAQRLKQTFSSEPAAIRARLKGSP